MSGKCFPFEAECMPYHPVVPLGGVRSSNDATAAANLTGSSVFGQKLIRQ